MKNIVFILLSLITQCAVGQKSKTYLFVGTYTDGISGEGIYVYEFNPKSGHLKKVSSGEGLVNPSFLTISLNGNFIYACTDTKLPHSGSVSAFKFDSTTGSITFINKQNSGGENPVFLTASKNNEIVINANYTEGTVTTFTTNPDGSLNPFGQLIRFEGSGINTRRQDKSHIHAAVFSPDYEYVFFPDLGADKIHVYQFDPNQLEPLIPRQDRNYSASPGSGPRHFEFHPNQQFAYCIEELSGTVTAFRYASGVLDSFQTIFSYSKIQDEFHSADIHISQDGRYLYASNRWENENTISIFSIDIESGRLTLVGHQFTFGDHPRNFTLDPTGNFLIVANQVTNNIVVFKRDIKSGLLKRTGKVIHVPSPSCLKMRVYGTS